MPNLDTGHYFLTVLAPIRTGTVQETNVSFVQNVREALAVMPTALQSPATEEIGINSPFALNRRTHFARFAVIGDVIFNGSTHDNALVNALRGFDPIATQPVDNLSSSYLMFTAVFDAVLQEGDPLPEDLSEAEQDAVRDAFARRLWDTMREEIDAIFSNCYGFSSVEDAEGFADYIRRCQVETTMPFNDYWLEAPKLHTLPTTALAALVLVPAAVAILALLSWLFGAALVWPLSYLIALPAGLTFVVAALLTALALYVAYRVVMSNGHKPMPPGRYASLPSVLKSLYVQQTFSDFAIDHQTATDREIHEAFGRFLAEHKPTDVAQPSQRPGVISIRPQGGVLHDETDLATTRKEAMR